MNGSGVTIPGQVPQEDIICYIVSSGNSKFSAYFKTQFIDCHVSLPGELVDYRAGSNLFIGKEKILFV